MHTQKYKWFNSLVESLDLERKNYNADPFYTPCDCCGYPVDGYPYGICENCDWYAEDEYDAAWGEDEENTSPEEVESRYQHRLNLYREKFVKEGGKLYFEDETE